MTDEMKVSLEEIQELVRLTKENTSALYGAVDEVKNQISTVIDGGYWVGDDAQSFKVYMMKDMGKAWSTARWLEQIAAELEAYVQKTLAQAEARAEKINADIE